MEADSPGMQAYLYKLNEMTDGDLSAQVSMYEVGDALGIENDEAGQMAEALLIGGQAEMKTLSGGIGITPMGLEALGITPASVRGTDALCLSNEVVLSDGDRESVETVLAEIKSVLASEQALYQTLETLVIDIKTIEVQMLSPAPKTAVVRALLNSIVQTLPETDFQEISHRITAMVKKG